MIRIDTHASGILYLGEAPILDVISVAELEPR
jgi:hypothetical protein